jgi:hypothetical protein
MGELDFLTAYDAPQGTDWMTSPIRRDVPAPRNRDLDFTTGKYGPPNSAATGTPAADTSLDFTTGKYGPSNSNWMTSPHRDSSLDFLHNDFDDTPHAAPSPELGWGDVPGALMHGLRHGIGDITQSGQAIIGHRPEDAGPASPAAGPYEFSDLWHPGSAVAKTAYRLGESSPTLAAGVAGGAAGSALTGGPWGTLGGGALGAAAGSALQTLGPAFSREMKATPHDPDGAWDRALHSAMASGAFSGAAWAAFPVKFFQGPLKQAAFQIFGVQPGLSVAHQVTENVEHDRPTLEGVPEAYTEGMAGTALPMAGQMAARKMAGLPAVTREPAEAPRDSNPDTYVKNAQEWAQRTNRAPSAETLDDIGNAYRKRAEAATKSQMDARRAERGEEMENPFVVDPEFWPGLGGYMREQLTRRGYDPRRQPELFDAVDRMSGSRFGADHSADLVDINNYRDSLSDLLSHTDEATRRGASVARDMIDTTLKHRLEGIDIAASRDMEAARQYNDVASAMRSWQRIVDRVNLADDKQAEFRRAVSDIVLHPERYPQFPPAAIAGMQQMMKTGFLDVVSRITHIADPTTIKGIMFDFMMEHFLPGHGLIPMAINVGARIAAGQRSVNASGNVGRQILSKTPAFADIFPSESGPLNGLQRFGRGVNARTRYGIESAPAWQRETGFMGVPGGTLGYARGGKVKRAMRLAEKIERRAMGGPLTGTVTPMPGRGGGFGGYGGAYGMPVPTGNGMGGGSLNNFNVTGASNSGSPNLFTGMGGSPFQNLNFAGAGRKSPFKGFAADGGIGNMLGRLFSSGLSGMARGGRTKADRAMQVAAAMGYKEGGKVKGWNHVAGMPTSGGVLETNRQNDMVRGPPIYNEPRHLEAIRRLERQARKRGGVVKKAIIIARRADGGVTDAPQDFKGRLYASGSPADDVEDRRGEAPPSSLFWRRFWGELDPGLYRSIYGKWEPSEAQINEALRLANPTSGHLAAEAGFGDIPTARADGGDVDAARPDDWSQLALPGEPPPRDPLMPATLPGSAQPEMGPPAPQPGWWDTLNARAQASTHAPEIRDAFQSAQENAAGMTQAGIESIANNRPATGVGQVGLGLMGGIASPFTALTETLIEHPAAGLGGEDFGRRAGLVAGLPFGGEGAAAKALALANDMREGMILPAPIALAAQARKLEDIGLEPDEIWRATRAFRGADGKWRTEALGPSRVVPGSISEHGYRANATTLGEAVAMPHAYEQMPALSRIPLTSNNRPALRDMGVEGMYLPYSADSSRRQGRIWVSPDLFLNDPLTVAQHEAQHGIQQLAGFSGREGGNPFWFKTGSANPDDPVWQWYQSELSKIPNPTKADIARLRDRAEFQRYWQSANEVEARNASAREEFYRIMRRSHGRRAADDWWYSNSPMQTQDYPYSEQLIGPPHPRRRGGRAVQRALRIAHAA